MYAHLVVCIFVSHKNIKYCYARKPSPGYFVSISNLIGSSWQKEPIGKILRVFHQKFLYLINFGKFLSKPIWVYFSVEKNFFPKRNNRTKIASVSEREKMKEGDLAVVCHLGQRVARVWCWKVWNSLKKVFKWGWSWTGHWVFLWSRGHSSSVARASFKKVTVWCNSTDWRGFEPRHRS